MPHGTHMPYKDRARQRAYQRECCAGRRALWLAEHGPCVECSSNVNLQVHHRDPEQKVSHKVWSWAIERRNAELAKCEVRCLDCHLLWHERTQTGHYTARRYV